VRRKPDQSAQKPDSATTAATATIADAAVKVGRLVPGSAVGALLVDFDGSAGGPRAARSIVMLDDKTLHQAIAVRQPVVLLFENGDPGLPIVVGLVPAAPGAELLAPLLVAPAAAVPASVARPAPAPAERIEAVVDGKRVVLEGRDEVVLRCGEASITLRRDGKLILRGAYVETHAKGVNRIKGGSVKIN
jgi:hypothetical protein